MSVHSRRIKQIGFRFGADAFECQVQTWQIVNNTEDGDRQYAQCPEGEFREETDDDYALELTFFADWRSGGVSDWLWDHDRQEVTVTIDHHPDIPAEHVQWTGVVTVKAPSVGGEARTTEQTEVTLQYVGRPVKTRF